MPKAKKAASTPDTATPAMFAPTPKGKLGILLGLLQRPEGVTLTAMQEATGWQAHSVRGALSGTFKKRLGLEVVSEKTEAGRVYRATQGAQA